MRRRGMWKAMAALFACAAVLLIGNNTSATPSTEYWSPCTMDVQAAETWHFTYDSYSTRRTGGDFPTDLGLEYGLRLSKVVNAEVGFDWLSKVSYPFYLNAKVGVAEGKLGKNSPGFSVGIFNVGTKKSDAAAGISGTRQNVIDIIVGKTVAKNLRMHAGYYRGSSALLRSSAGQKKNSGFMFAFDYGFKPTKDGYNRFAFIGDYMSGKNALGGGGVGLTYNFAANAGVIVGPVWFNDQGLNGKVKWTTQLDVNF